MRKFFVIISLMLFVQGTSMAQGQKPARGLPFFERTGKSAMQDGKSQCADILAFLINPEGFMRDLASGKIKSGFKPVLFGFLHPGKTQFTLQEILEVHDMYLELYSTAFEIPKNKVVEFISTLMMGPAEWTTGEVAVGFIEQSNASYGESAFRRNYPNEWALFYGNNPVVSCNCGNPLYKEGSSKKEDEPIAIQEDAPSTQEETKKFLQEKNIHFPEISDEKGIHIYVVNYNNNSNPNQNTGSTPARQSVYERVEEPYYNDEYYPEVRPEIRYEDQGYDYQMSRARYENEMIARNHQNERFLANQMVAQSRGYRPMMVPNYGARLVSSPNYTFQNSCAGQPAQPYYQDGGGYYYPPQRQGRPVLDALGRGLGFVAKGFVWGATGHLGGKVINHLLPNFGNDQIRIVGNRNRPNLGPLDQPWTPTGGGDDGFIPIGTGGGNGGWGGSAGSGWGRN